MRRCSEMVAGEKWKIFQGPMPRAVREERVEWREEVTRQISMGLPRKSWDLEGAGIVAVGCGDGGEEVDAMAGMWLIGRWWFCGCMSLRVNGFDGNGGKEEELRILVEWSVLFISVCPQSRGRHIRLAVVTLRFSVVMGECE